MEALRPYYAHPASLVPSLETLVTVQFQRDWMATTRQLAWMASSQKELPTTATGEKGADQPSICPPSLGNWDAKWISQFVLRERDHEILEFPSLLRSVRRGCQKQSKVEDRGGRCVYNLFDLPIVVVRLHSPAAEAPRPLNEPRM